MTLDQRLVNVAICTDCEYHRGDDRAVVCNHPELAVETIDYILGKVRTSYADCSRYNSDGKCGLFVKGY